MSSMEADQSNRKWRMLAGANLLDLATTADGPNFNAALPTMALSPSMGVLTCMRGLDGVFRAICTPGPIN